MRVLFWGTRGSIATPGPATLKYGGNTSCVSVETDSGQRFILDAGTGIRPLGAEWMARAPKPLRATILLGHTHWDHIQGFPFFAPAFIPGNEFVICAPGGGARSLADVLAGQMEFTYFPVELAQLPSKIEYRQLSEGTYDFDGVRVIAQYLNHPAASLGYRIEADRVVVVYMCDHEPFGPAVWPSGSGSGKIDSIVHAGDRRHAELMKHADLLIHDAQYTPEEYPAKNNWGHSTFEYAVELAAAADVRQLALTHHDPIHDDEQLDRIEERARARARLRNFLLHVFCAAEGMEVRVAPPESDRLRTVDVAETPLAIAQCSRSVLVVDDDPNLRLLVKAALGRAAFNVGEAQDGIDALNQIKTCVPDLLLLDVNMPQMDGITLLGKLRSDDRTRDLPVILLTAQGDEKSMALGFETGATDYLVKPFTIPQLTARVRAALSRYSRSELVGG